MSGAGLRVRSGWSPTGSYTGYGGRGSTLLPGFPARDTGPVEVRAKRSLETTTPNCSAKTSKVSTSRSKQGFWAPNVGGPCLA